MAAEKTPKRRSSLIAVFETFDKPVRLYAPSGKNPYFRVAFYEPTNPNKQIDTSATRDEAYARRWAADKADELRRIQGVPHPERPTQSVAVMVQQFLDTDTNGRVWKHRTIEKYGELEKKLPGWFLEIRCKDITAEVLQKVVDEFAATPTTPKMTKRPENMTKAQKKAAEEARVEKEKAQSIKTDAQKREDAEKERRASLPEYSYVATFRAFVSAFMTWAENRGYVLPNQLPRVPITVKRNDLDEGDSDTVDPRLLPTRETLAKLLGLVTNPILNLMIRVTLVTGMRFSELVALTWHEIDLENGLITVKRAVSEDNRGLQKLASTKNRKTRIVSFSATDLPDMTERYNAAKLDEANGGKGLIFPAAKKGWLRRSNFSSRTWRPLVSRVPELNDEFCFHQLRHCAAVAMLEDGINIVTLSATLGHADVRTTERVYLKCRENYFLDVAKRNGWQN